MQAASALNADRWRRIEDLFHAASQCDPASRSAFLDDACGTDVELRREVESLLAISHESESFLQETVQNVAESYVEKQATPPVALGTVLDHYQIIQLLGAGGMGEVYLAEDTWLKRKVALKMLPRHLTSDPLAMRRLEQEAQIVSALNHANVLTVFEFCHCEGRHFLVTEFIEGETLRELLDRGPLAQTKAADIASQAAAALSAAHALGVVHRDIKPENIIVRADGVVKVLDFGIAKLTENAKIQTESTTVGAMVLGTPRYMSPEQARGTKIDKRTDLFSLGAVLYEMLAGKAPFKGETQSDLIADILRTDPEPLAPGIPKALHGIVTRALAKDPALRYQRAEDLLSDLQQFQKDSEFKKRYKPPVPWLLLPALLACAAILVFLFLRHRVPEPPRSLAVLPFRNMKPELATDFLGFSLADEVTARLGYVKALTVRPSSAVSRYRDGSIDLHKAARDLNADLLLTGTYLKDGDDLRITARLIGINPETVLWQNTLNLKYDKLLTVQDRVAQMIVQGLELKIGPDEQVHMKSGVPASSLAYEYYLRGVDLYSTANFSGAISMLEKSAALDPNYAPTFAYLGRAYTTNGSLQFGGRDSYLRAEQAYNKAISLNPVFPEPRI